MTHKPDPMIELSTRTKAAYTYVKDWMMLRECLAGCLGALQTMSHQNVKLKIVRLPEGSPAKFVKISGALQITKRATGKDAEASLGDLRFGDKRRYPGAACDTFQTTLRKSSCLKILGRPLFQALKLSEVLVDRRINALCLLKKSHLFKPTSPGVTFFATAP